MSANDPYDKAYYDFWDEVTGPDGPPKVGLFPEGDKNLDVYWERDLNRMVCIPKNFTARVDRLGAYLELYLATDASDVLGFQLISFSRFTTHIWEILGRRTDERVSLGEILHFYEGVSCAGVYAKATGREISSLREKFEELRELFGHITILRLNHARTIAL